MFNQCYIHTNNFEPLNNHYLASIKLSPKWGIDYSVDVTSSEKCLQPIEQLIGLAECLTSMIKGIQIQGWSVGELVIIILLCLSYILLPLSGFDAFRVACKLAHCEPGMDPGSVGQDHPQYLVPPISTKGNMLKAGTCTCKTFGYI